MNIASTESLYMPGTNILRYGKSATIEPSFDSQGNPDWYVELFVDGRLVRGDAFKTERGAMRVVDSHFKAGR